MGTRTIPWPLLDVVKYSVWIPDGSYNQGFENLQSVQLFPCFSGSWRADWTHNSILEKYNTFFINTLQT